MEIRSAFPLAERISINYCPYLTMDNSEELLNFASITFF